MSTTWKRIRQLLHTDTADLHGIVRGKLDIPPLPELLNPLLYLKKRDLAEYHRLVTPVTIPGFNCSSEQSNVIRQISLHFDLL